MNDETADLPPLRFVMSERRMTRCQAWEDGCEYDHCPRWQDGKIINHAHCALDLIEDEND